MAEHAGTRSKTAARLASLRVSLTGFDVRAREEIATEIARHGGVVTPRLDLTVDLLIVPNRGALTEAERSAKVEFATKHGILILPVQEVLEFGDAPTETHETSGTMVDAKQIAERAPPMVPQSADGGGTTTRTTASSSTPFALHDFLRTLHDTTIVVTLVLGSPEQRDQLFRWSSLTENSVFFVQPCITRQTTHVVIGSLVRRGCQRTVDVLEEFLKTSRNMQRQNVMSFSWLEALFDGCDDEFSDWDLQQRLTSTSHEQHAFLANAVTRNIAVRLQGTLEPAPTLRPLARNVPPVHVPPTKKDEDRASIVEISRCAGAGAQQGVEDAIVDAHAPSRTTEDSVWNALAALCREGGIPVDDVCHASEDGKHCKSSTERTLHLLNTIFCGGTPESTASLTSLFRGMTFLCEEREKSLTTQSDVFDRDRIAALRLFIKCAGGTLIRKRPSEIATMVAEKDPVLRARRGLDLPDDEKQQPQQHLLSPRTLCTVVLLPHAFERCTTQEPQQRRFRLDARSSLRGTKNKRQRQDDQREAFPSVDSLRLPHVTSTWIVASVLSQRRLRYDESKRRERSNITSVFIGGSVMTHLRCHTSAFTGIPIECFGHGAASMRRLVDGLALPMAPSVFLLERRYLKHSLHHEMLLALNPAASMMMTSSNAAATSADPPSAPATIGSTDVGHGVHVFVVTEALPEAGASPEQPFLTAVDTAHLERAVAALGGVMEGVYFGATGTLPPPAVFARITHVVTDRAVNSVAADPNDTEARFLIDKERCSVEVADLLRWVSHMAAVRQDVVLVDASWLTTSLRYGYFVEEEEFEIRGVTTGAGRQHSSTVAEQRLKVVGDNEPFTAVERTRQCEAAAAATDAAAARHEAPPPHQSMPRVAEATAVALVSAAVDVPHATRKVDGEGGDEDEVVVAEALAASVALLERSVGEGNGSAVKRPRNFPLQVKVEPSANSGVSAAVPDVGGAAGAGAIRTDAAVVGEAAAGGGGRCGQAEMGAESPTAAHRLCPLPAVAEDASNTPRERVAAALDCSTAANAEPHLAVPPPPPVASKECARVYVLSSHPELPSLKRLVQMFAIERPCLTVDGAAASTASHRASSPRWTCFSWALSPFAADIVVTNEVTQRESVLLAIAAGAWLVSSQYLTACFREQRICDIEPYEWTEQALTGEQTKKRASVLLARNCRFWRTLRADCGQGPMGAPCIHQVILLGCPHDDILSSIVTAGAGVCRIIPVDATEQTHQGQPRALDAALRQLDDVLLPVASTRSPGCRRGSLAVVLVPQTLLESSQAEICQRIELRCRAQRLQWGLTAASLQAPHLVGDTEVIGAGAPCHYARHVVDAAAPCAERTDVLRIEVHQPEWISLTLQRRAEKLTPVFQDYM